MIEQQFSALIEQSPNTIFISGDVGTGKSRLAYELTQRHSIEPTLNRWIRGDDMTLAGDDVRSILHSWDISFNECGSLDGLIRQLIPLMLRPDGPEYIVLDSIVDPTFLLGLPSTARRTILVVTSNKAVANESQILVTDMLPEESAGLISGLSPGLSDSEVTKISQITGARPRVIEQLCHLLKYDAEISVAEVERGIRTKPQLLLLLAEPSWKNRLSSHYRQMLEIVRRENPVSEHLLAIICLLGGHWPRGLYSVALAWIMNVFNERIMRITHEQAESCLVEHSLIRVTDDSSVAINPIARLVMQGLMSGGLQRLRQELRRVFTKVIEDKSKAADHMSDPLHLRLAVKALDESPLIDVFNDSLYGSNFFVRALEDPRGRLYSKTGAKKRRKAPAQVEFLGDRGLLQVLTEVCDSF